MALYVSQLQITHLILYMVGLQAVRTVPAVANDRHGEHGGLYCVSSAIEVKEKFQDNRRPVNAGMELSAYRFSHAGQRSLVHDTTPAWFETVEFSDQLDPFRDDWPFW